MGDKIRARNFVQRHGFPVDPCAIEEDDPTTFVLKRLEAAENSWRRLDGHNPLSKLVLGLTISDGIEVSQPTGAAT